MAKTCRTCEDSSRHWRCTIRQSWVRAKHSCRYHKPRETPLLVDAFAAAARVALEKVDSVGLEARDALGSVLARYYKEVGDAQD